MTNEEYRLKYPIGATIIYTPNINVVDYDAVKDAGKRGIVVGYLGSAVKIYLPTSSNQKGTFGNLSGKQVTWRCRWEHIVPAIVKNQQLLFAFME